MPDLSALLAHLRGLRENALASEDIARVTLSVTREHHEYANALLEAAPVLLRELEALEECRRSGALAGGAAALTDAAGEYGDDPGSGVPEGYYKSDDWTGWDTPVVVMMQEHAAALRRLAAGEEET